MSFVYGAGTWYPNPAAAHATDVLQQINLVLSANNVLDSSGNQIQFAASLGNIVWILCLALGAIRAQDDQILLQASQQFSIAQESTAQLLETLPMTGTSLIPGAYSLVTLSVTAGGSGATVPAGTAAALGTICNFLTLATTVIGSGSTALILAQANLLGSIVVAPGQLSAFTTTVPGVANVTNLTSAIVGRAVETPNQIRQRLLAGNVIQTNLGGTIIGIQSIQGITQAVVYLNQSPTNNLVLQGPVNVPPLSAYIVIAGFDITNVAIANAYAARMLAQTFSVGPGTPAPYTRTDLSFSASANSISTVAGNFVTAGFAAGQWLTVVGSGSNNVTFQVGSANASTIIATLSSTLFTAESDANSITLTAKNVQVYTTQSGQLIPILFDYATFQQVYVEVFYVLGTGTISGFTAAIASIVASISWTIGQTVTSAAIMQALAGYQYATIDGCQVSLGISGPWSNAVYPNGNSIPQILVANVTVLAG